MFNINATEFNYVEAGIWFLFTLVLLIGVFKQGKHSPYFRNLIIASFFFLLFGISDIIEAHTGAWWKPLWLLILKGICLIAFVGCAYQYNKIKKKT